MVQWQIRGKMLGQVKIGSQSIVRFITHWITYIGIKGKGKISFVMKRKILTIIGYECKIIMGVCIF